MPILAEIPFDRAIAEAYARGRVIAEASPALEATFAQARQDPSFSGRKPHAEVAHARDSSSSAARAARQDLAHGAFAHLAENKAICDLDVDALDLHLLLRPTRERTEEFHSGYEAQIDGELCNGCGLCASLCRFGAIRRGTGLSSIPSGARAAVAFCPVEAVRFELKHCGQWYVSSTCPVPMVHAQLIPGGGKPGRLVMVLKQQACSELAQAKGLDLVLCDGAPALAVP